ncbi:MAG TPA: PhoPQ-activated protein PqaA family protein [Gemmataceae bacterium]|nr:PhoPQ-activated protein PqaA family protein [Gemmataceae bacterium]
MPRRPLTALPVLLLFALPGLARADLHEYVKKPEPDFAWKPMGNSKTDAGTVYTLHLVSQNWQGIKWEHQLQVYQPKGVEPNGTMLLWNQGGKPSAGSVAFGMQLAKLSRSPVAFLFGIPNQPLLDGKTEDALIAETFLRFLKTKDENWPLLFPMVKSLVKAMDALQAFSKEQWKQPVRSFVVTGGSKRGWTTWLTAAADPRVKAIAPMVIDVLNMPAQMENQYRSFGGKYSEMIHNYTDTGLVPMPKTPEAKRLWTLVDPYAYRDKLTMPKLMVLGNNDPYWATDALNLYWDGLKGEKYVLYVPNAGHNLQRKGPDGKPDLSRPVQGLSAYLRHQVTDRPLPKLSWKHAEADGKLMLTVAADPAPRGARLWVAEAPTRDFRKAEWKEQPATIDGKAVKGAVPAPESGCKALYAELDYEIDGIPYHLSTQLRIAGKPAEKK